MREEVKNAIDEHVTTIGEQFDNASAALAAGDTAKLEKSLNIIEKVARILIVLIGAVKGAKGAAKVK